MKTEHSDSIRRLESGCINTAYYLQRGRTARSQRAFDLLGLLVDYAKRYYTGRIRERYAAAELEEERIGKIAAAPCPDVSSQVNNELQQAA